MSEIIPLIIQQMDRVIKKENTIRYAAFILIQSVVYGFGNPLTKVAYRTLTPFWLLSVRFLLAFALFWIFKRQSIKSLLRPSEMKIWLPSALCGSAAYISINMALNLTSATNVGFLMSLPVLFAPILESVVKKRKYQLRHLPLQFLAVVGLYMLCCNGGSFTFRTGDLLALLSALFLAGMLVFGESAVSKLDPVAFTACQAGTTAVCSLVLALLFEDSAVLKRADLPAWLVVVYLAVTCTILAYLMQNIAIRHLSSRSVSMLQCTQPILTAAASFLLLRETLSTIGLIGAAVIIVAVLLDTMQK